jgi:hypothetical protein
MTRVLTLLAAVVPALTTPIVQRDGEPFVGTGAINVVTLNNKAVGCLTNTMAFTPNTNSCGTFTITKTIGPPAYPYGERSITYNVSTPVGACGEPLQTGATLQEGKNRILLCGAESDSDNSFWSVSYLQFPPLYLFLISSRSLAV